jgi:hypothetical protein
VRFQCARDPIRGGIERRCPSGKGAKPRESAMTARLSISIVKIGVRGQTPLRLEISLKEPHGIVDRLGANCRIKSHRIAGRRSDARTEGGRVEGPRLAVDEQRGPHRPQVQPLLTAGAGVGSSVRT